MFGPGTTVIHQGTYLTVILAIAASYLVFWLLHPVLAGVLACFHIICNVVLFIWLTPTSEPGIGMSFGPINGALAAVCTLSGVGCIAVLMPVGIRARKAAISTEQPPDRQSNAKAAD